jgi:hypothetical protein
MYNSLFEKQKVIIERIKRDIETLDKLHNEYKMNELKNDELENDEVESDSSVVSNENLDFEDANISDNLRLALGLGTKSDFYNELSWTPPSRSGLDNSNPIISKNQHK